MTTTEASIGERLAAHVATKASELQSAYRTNKPAAVADLALLRRGVALRPGQDVRLIGLTFAGLYANPKGDTPLPAEVAAYDALTLFALHQQSHRDSGMHRVGYSLGRSVRLLGKHSGAEAAVRARFTAVATATSHAELLHHARGLITQFRAFDIPLDYGQFARDLFDLQFPSSADRVRLAWGRHFYRVRHAEDDGVESVENETGDLTITSSTATEESES